jgi:flagellar hook protein FlgE
MAVSFNPAVSSVMSTGVQGLQAGFGRANQAAGEIARAGQPESGGDLASSLVDLKVSENQVKASAAVIKTADEMLGTLIDTMA